MKEEDEVDPRLLPPLLDIRKICRDSRLCLTTVRVVVGYRSHLWIVGGQMALDEGNDKRVATLKAYLGDSTDEEHDSAYALSIPLIGLRYSGVRYQQTSVKAWVAPRDLEGFNLPPQGYDPRKGARTCKDPACKDKHHFVPYLPPVNPDVYRIVAGLEVEMTFGPAFPELRQRMDEAVRRETEKRAPGRGAP